MLNRQIDSIRSLERLETMSEHFGPRSPTDAMLDAHRNEHQVNVASQANGGFSPLRRLRPVSNVRNADLDESTVEQNCTQAPSVEI